jgi:hypothetical protein
MEGVSLSAAKAARVRAADRTGFTSLPPLVQLGVGLVAASGVAATVVGLAGLPLDRWPTLLGLLLACLLAGAVKVPVPFSPGAAGLPWSYVANLLSVVLIGPWPSVPVTVAAAWGTSERSSPSAPRR